MLYWKLLAALCFAVIYSLTLTHSTTKFLTKISLNTSGFQNGVLKEKHNKIKKS